ncbi:CHU large protein [Filimonas lacunae]|nr:CHU large protein [Filimonas lacunae]
MVLYLTADEPAVVEVSIPGTTYRKVYNVPANTSLPTEPLPKSGAEDCRITDEGLFTKNVHIVSNVPVVVFEHTYGNFSSGGSMLLPVEVYGYTYFAQNTRQLKADGFYSWFYIVASEDNTTVSITPKLKTKNGHDARQAFTVNLKKGEIYNVMAENNAGTDMSGSKIQSLPGSDGNCHRIAVFSGSSRTGLEVDQNILGGGGSDFMMVQGFPVSAWGSKYLTAPTSTTLGAANVKQNGYRVYVRDPNTTVKRNGVTLTGLQQTSYYEFKSATADYITADQPISVSQFIFSQDVVGRQAGDDGDPEMFYLTPLEQAIDHVIFYSNQTENIEKNFLTLIIPESGMASLLLDGSNSFDASYPHPNLSGYRVVVKELPITPMQHSIISDTLFTAITYGLGNYESYGYNAGAYVSNLAAIPEIKPVNRNGVYDYVCSKTPFSLSLKTFYQPTSLTIHFSMVNNVTPATDVTINNPVASATTVINGITYYTYDIPDQYQFNTGGEYSLPVSIADPTIDNCKKSEIVNILIPVVQGPSVDFSVQPVCVSESAQFTYIPISTDAHFSKWNFGDGTENTVDVNPLKKYNTDGNYDVKLQVIRDYDGCWGDTVKSVEIKPLPVVDFTMPDVICMPEGKAVMQQKVTLKGVEPAVMNLQWTFGDGSAVATEKQPEHTYASKGNYDVKLIATVNGCTDSLTKTLPVTAFNDKPIADFAFSDTAYCLGEQTRLGNLSTVNAALATSWQWQLGNGETDTVREPSTVYATAKAYSVTLTVNNGGCISDPVKKDVRVYALPVVEAGSDVIIDAGNTATLQGQVSSDVTSFKWTPDIALSSDNVLYPVASPKTSQVYYLTATNRVGCINSDSVLVKVYNDIKIPNIFTPNGDGINDVWDIKGLQDYSRANISIFNRWGQLVYHVSGNYYKPWNGAGSNGSVLPAGIYYYILEPNANGYGKLTGSVTIVR